MMNKLNPVLVFVIALILPLAIMFILNSDPLFDFVNRIERQVSYEDKWIWGTAYLSITFIPSLILIYIAHKNFRNRILAVVAFIICSLILAFPYIYLVLIYVCAFFQRCL